MIKMQQVQNASKEKELQNLGNKLKTFRGKIEQAKTKNLNAQHHTVGFDKLNDLESKLKDS